MKKFLIYHVVPSLGFSAFLILFLGAQSVQGGLPPPPSVPPPACGDGVVNQDREECDPGSHCTNTDTPQSCILDIDCIPVCNDCVDIKFLIEIPDFCQINTDNEVCGPNCQLRCGNGELEEGEQCEPSKVCSNSGEPCENARNCINIDVKASLIEITCDPIDTEECRADCTDPTCGDNILDNGEACDGEQDEACGDLGCASNCSCNEPAQEEPQDEAQVLPAGPGPLPLAVSGNCASSLIPLDNFHPSYLNIVGLMGLALAASGLLRLKARQSAVRNR